MRGREVRLVAVVGFLFLLLFPVNNRAFGSRSAPFSLVLLPQARADDGKEDYGGIVGRSYAGTLWPDPCRIAASAAAAPFSIPQFFFFSNQVTQSFLICNWSLCSSSISIAAVVVDKKKKRTEDLKGAVWVRAHQRWRLQRGIFDRGWLAACHPRSTIVSSGRRAAIVIPPSRCAKREAVWLLSGFHGSPSRCGSRRRSYEGHGVPSGFVPGNVKAQSGQKLSRT